MALTSDVTGRRGRSILPIGCILWPGLIAAGCFIGGAVAMSNWDSLSGLSKTGAIVLIVAGTLLLIPVLLMASFLITMRRLFRQLTEIDEAGHIKVTEVYYTSDDRPDERMIDAPQDPPLK